MASASISSFVGAPSPAGPTLFELRAGPFVGGELRVLELTGREGLSKLFSFEVLVASDLPAWELEAAVLGRSATLVLPVAQHPPRVVHGIVASIRVEPAWKAEHATRRYTLRLVPGMWKLGKRVNSRIFQDQTAAEVIGAVMREAGLAVRFDLSQPLPRRAYCVQYQESDLDFVKRLLAEAGCFFYFEPPAGILESLGLGAAAAGIGAVATFSASAAIGAATGTVETLVVSDQASFYPAIADGAADAIVERVAGAIGNPVVSAAAAAAPTLVFRDPSGMRVPNEETVTRLRLRRSVRSNAVTLRDYLYERPLFDATASSTTKGAAGLAGAASALATAAVNDVGAALRGGQPGGAGAAALDLLGAVAAEGETREVYRHHSDFFDHDAKAASAQVELEQHRRKALTAEGTSTCRRLASGHKFALASHDEERMNRVWVVTSVKHRGITVEWASAQGHAAEAMLQYENAFTCAPAELTIRPRRPPPRAVQVADTAVVVGPEGREVYTDALGRIKVQFHWDRYGKKNEHSSCWLRVMHTWAGSSWGTQFIPRVGMEVLVLYHQGDPDRPVVIGCLPNAVTPHPFPLPDDATRSGVRTNTLPGGGGHNELSFEDRRGSEQVYLHAQRNYDEVVQHDHTVRVGADERETVEGHRHHTVDGNDALRVGGDRAASVGGDRTETVRGERVVRVEGNARETIGGLEMRTVKGSAFLHAGGHYQLTIGGSAGTVVGSHDAPTESHTSVWGKSSLFASDQIRIASEKTIVLECGDSRVTLTPDMVRIEAKAVVVAGSDSTSIFGKKPVMHLTDTVSLATDALTVTTKSASLALDTNATLLGTQVKLGKPEGASTKARDLDPAETKPFSVQLCDDVFKPYANKPYDLMAGGVKLHGTTDGDGYVKEKVPKDATRADLTLWLQPPPTGAHQRWQVRIEDELPPPTDVRGAQLRLRNLGYFMGEPDGTMSEGLRNAIRAFQRDQDLPNDGQLGGVTTTKLAKAHGH